ncbi:MAG: hypothetical protein U0350_24770 [Caldilineaceae bacterium]
MQETASPAITFVERLKQVLKWYANPRRIGEESPLAAPYFLSHRLTAQRDAANAEVRGQALCQAVLHAAEQLWGANPPRSRNALLNAIQEVRQQPETHRYAYIVLELRIFQRYVAVPRQADIWEKEEFLPGSRAEHYRDFDRAVRLLAPLLIEQLQPPSAPEAIRLPVLRLGYELQQTEILAALRAGKSVALSGASGVGKSTLAAALRTQMTEFTHFGFTIRPGLNDTFSSLLFAIGHFFHSQGAPNLWGYLIANQGNSAERNLALSLLRADLAQLNRTTLIFWFDEVDLLLNHQPEATQPQHHLLLEFLESLRGEAAQLFISQVPVLEADVQIDLQGLAIHHIPLWWRHEGLAISHAEVQQLYRTTQGNPRLLKLCLNLQRAGETLAEILAQLATKPGIAPIFRRIWQRLSEPERSLLQRLAVYRQSLPDHLWEMDTLQRLLHRQLIEQVAVGRIQPMPVIAQMVNVELTPETRQRLHWEAANLRYTLAEYTEAVWHYWQADALDRAVQVWYLHHEQEILHGNAETAQLIFAQMARERLDQPERKAFDRLWAELCRLSGQFERGLQGLAQVDWREESHATVRLHELRGQFLAALQDEEGALGSYEQGIRMIARLLSRQIQLYHRRSLIQMNRRAIEPARREARLGECTLLILQGQLEEVTGQYQDALLSAQKALLIARNLRDDKQIMEASRLLAELYGLRLEQLEEALPYYTLAIDACEQMGDRLTAERTRSNLAATLLQNGQFGPALHEARQAYTFLKASQDAHFFPSAAINVAEAAFETGDLATALHYATEALEAEDAFVYPYAHFELGRIKQAMGDLPTAEAHFAESLRFSRQHGDQPRLAYALRELGKCHRKMQKNAEAKAEMTEALHLFIELQLANEVQRTQVALAQMSLEVTSV